MRKLSIALFTLTFSIVLNAQQTPADSLKEYTGKYKFPEGSPVSEVTLTLQDGVLFGASAMGSSEFRRIEKDLFAVVAYSGTATFKRNDQAKVNGVKIEVDDLVLEGTKSEEAIYQPDRIKILMIKE